MPSITQFSRAGIALALLLASATAGAQGRIILRPCPPPPCPRDVVCSPPIIFRCGGRGGAPRVEHTNTRVRVALVDRVLRYEVTETFENRGSNLGEADYMFPLPTGSAFEDVRLEINGELVAGETMDAGRARAEYERIVREQRDPALVEWMGAGLLRARIFPFNAGEKRTIAVRYQQVAPREGDALRVEFRRPDAQDNTRNSLQIELPVNGYGEPYSPTHDLTVRREGNHRIAELRGNARDVVVLVPVPRNAEASIGVLTHAAGAREKFALVTVAPPAVSSGRSSRDITFVMDVSGSMSGGKLAQAKAAGRQLLNTLDGDDRFRLVDFATDVHTFRDNFIPATTANIRAAQQYLDGLRAEGSTNVSGALQDALEAARNQSSERLSLVLFLTDGEPTVGIRNPITIADSVRAWRGRVRLFTFGLGADVNASLVEQLALDGRGLAHFVRPDESVERMVGLVATRLQRPILTDVRVEGVGVRFVQQYPSPSTDLYAGQELVVLARYEGNGAGAVRVTGQSANGRVEWRTGATFPDRSNANAFVPRLWATQRIGWLSAERRRDGSSAELDDELRSLGLRYGIPTELTSYMVQEPRRLSAAVTNQSANVRAGGGGRAGAGFAGGAAVAAAPPAADAAAPQQRAFEMAKSASVQRDVRSVATLDSLNNAAYRREGENDQSSRSALNRRFELQQGVWTETRLVRGDMATAWTVRVQAYSPAWFALVKAVPALKEVFALGDRVRLAGTSVVLEVTPNGVSTLDDATITRFTAAW
ncbi:MAG: VWA domain-containing protein [Phycisphaerae bacterium]|nr:VWA domain-containing protein [Gemmatimonadaceae bacterium]